MCDEITKTILIDSKDKKSKRRKKGRKWRKQKGEMESEEKGKNERGWQFVGLLYFFVFN